MSTSLLSRLNSLGIRLALVGNDLDLEGPSEIITDELLAELKLNKSKIVESLKADTIKRSNPSWWIDRIKQAQSQQEIFDILTRFQPLDWTDAERALMSHAYHRQLIVF